MTDTSTHAMTRIAPTASAVLGLPCPAAAREPPIAPIVDALAGRARLALLVPDAFGLLAWTLWNGEMPFLRSLHGRHSAVLRSVMPSITPVNFATMVTGAELAVHGVRTFRGDFACETLFDVVRAAGGLSAGVGLSGYTGSELLGRCADLRGEVVRSHGDEGVAAAVIALAELHRPRFLIAQFGQVDDVFHRHGPTSPEVVPMLRATDARLARVMARLAALGYGVIVLADHGQHDTNLPFMRGTHGTDSDDDCLVPCTWA